MLDWLTQVRVDCVVHREKDIIIVTGSKIVSRMLFVRRTCVLRADEDSPRIAYRVAATVCELLEREKELDMLGESP